ncbi:putative EPS-depolymerase [Pantoea phage vB_PagS_AAS21]|uniref:Putative EPS-depolymerase n=1 Tax=Pantoea phage vB_PagS_AAS21 TaxID=2575261 RepID=A0A4Y5P1R8_9CAUD|nr:putative EPS-depolymerase [Pantoea phage vB_PagS_AAS21]
MQLIVRVVQDRQGAVLPYAEGHVYLKGTNTPATIYNANGTQIDNPVQADEHGVIQFKAADGLYDFQVSFQGTLGIKTPIQCIDGSEKLAQMDERVTFAETAATTANTAKVAATTAASEANTAKTQAVAQVSLAKDSADAAKTSETNSKNSETAAKASQTAAKTSETNSKASETAAKASEEAAAQSVSDTVFVNEAAQTAKMDAVNAANEAGASRTAAVNAKTAAETAAGNARTSETNAKTSETNASQSQVAAEAAAVRAEEAAASGGSGTPVDLSGYMKKADNLSGVANPATALDNIGGLGKDALNGVSNVTALRARQPAYDGERVYLKCHTPAALAVYRPEGGGWFTGTKTSSQPDDGGYNIKAGTGVWTREKAIEDLTIADFGGVADNTTDATPAFKANLDFISSAYAKSRVGNTLPYLTIKFNAGYYYMTPGDYRQYGSKLWSGAPDEPYYPSGYSAAAGISIMGARVEYGRELLTWIKSDKSDLPVFQLNHRRQSVSFIGFDGQQTTGYDQYNKDTNPTGTNMLIGATFGVWNDTASNKQQFMTNECAGGLYLKISACQYKDIGGDMFFVRDTLDTVIEYCFGSKNAAPFFTTSWSNRVAGAWDHSTSVEIRNCNFGTPLSPVIRAPRCGQSLMWNVWAEHGTTPFDINNGQWDMTMVCLEDNRGEMCLWNSKHSIRTLSVPTGNSKSIDSPTSGKYQGYLKNPDGSDLSAWAEGYGQGSYLLMNYGAYFDCPVVSKVTRGYIRGENNTDNVIWVNVGSFSSNTNGSMWKIRVLGALYYNTTANQNMLSDALGGETVIYVGRGASNVPKISFHNINGGVLGASPQYQVQPYNTLIPAVWVPIRARCGEYTISVEQTGTHRGETGQPASYTPNGNTITTNPNQTAIPGRFSFNTRRAGFGANEDVVEITSRRQTIAQAPVDTTYPIYTRIAMGGVEVAVVAYPYIPQWTTKAPATVSVAAGGALSIAPTVIEAVSYQWQKSTDGGSTWNAINGATSMTYTKAAVTADDAGMYRLGARQTNGMGGNGTTVFGETTTVTIT